MESAADRVSAWLGPRLEEVPGELGEAVREAVDRGLDAIGSAGRSTRGDESPGSPEGVPRGVEPGRTEPEPLPDPASVPDTLAWIAVRELDRVADAPQDREAAVRLLAADACLTWAFEAAAESDEEMEGLVDRAGLRGRIGRLLGRTGTDADPDAAPGEGGA